MNWIKRIWIISSESNGEKMIAEKQEVSAWKLHEGLQLFQLSIDS